jgi:hypothetical protein
MFTGGKAGKSAVAGTVQAYQAGGRLKAVSIIGYLAMMSGFLGLLICSSPLELLPICPGTRSCFAPWFGAVLFQNTSDPPGRCRSMATICCVKFKAWLTEPLQFPIGGKWIFG